MMKSILMALSIASLAQASPFYIQQYDLNINLSQEKAVLSRSTTLTLPKGTHTLIYSQLPSQLKLDQISLQADKLQVREMQIQKTPQTERIHQLDQIDLAISNIDVRLRTGLTNENKIKQLTEQRFHLQKNRDQLAAIIENPLNHELHITVEVPKAMTVPVHLNYVNEESYWQADYEAHYQQGQLNLHLYATIHNESTENWENAHIQLSTAKTQAILPSSYAWQIGAAQNTLADDPAPLLYQGKSSLLHSPRHAQAVQASEQTFSMDYDIGQSIHLKHQQNTRQSLQSIHLPASVHYEVWPQSSQNVYLSSEQSLPFPLPAGKLKTYINGKFGAESFLKNTYAHEPFSLVLGQDKLIKVNHEQQLTQSSKQEMETIRLHQQTTISNHHSYAVDVRVHQQIPLSQHQDILVESSAPTVDEKGFYTQLIHLKPQGTEKIAQDIYIRYPSKLSLYGLRH